MRFLVSFIVIYTCIGLPIISDQLNQHATFKDIGHDLKDLSKSTYNAITKHISKVVSKAKASNAANTLGGNIADRWQAWLNSVDRGLLHMKEGVNSE